MEAEPVVEESRGVSQILLLRVVWSLTAVSFTFLCFRIYVQATTFRRLFIDDFLVIAAWLMILTAATIWQIEGGALYELYEITNGGAIATEGFLLRYNRFMRFLAPFEILFYSALLAIKLSFLTLFHRLCSQIKSLRIWWKVVLFFTVSVFVFSVGDVEYKCSFGGIEYIISQCSNIEHIHYENRTFWANAAGDVLSDMMILSIPTMVLWNARIPCRKKVILLGIFSATIFIMAIAIVRVAVDTTLNQQINISWLCFWSFVEVDTAIIVSCIASLRQLFVSLNIHASRGKSSNQAPSGSTPLKQRALYFPSQGQFATEVDSQQGESVLLSTVSPLSIIHHQEFRVTRTVMPHQSQA